MIRLSFTTLAAVTCAAAFSAALPWAEAQAQQRPQHGGGPTSFFAGGYAQSFNGASSLGVSGIAVNVNPQGGSSINILNLGASQSFVSFGPGRGGPPSVSVGPGGIPGFSGGSLSNFLGINGVNVQVGGGGGGDGVSINIANIGISSTFVSGHGHGGSHHGRSRRYRGGPEGGSGGGAGGADGGNGGGGDGGSDGGGGGG